MRNTPRNILILGVAFLASSACSSEEPLGPGPDPDAGLGGGPDGGAPDGGGPVDGLVGISGTALRLENYLGGSRVPVPEAEITALGVNGVSPVMSGPDGTYSIRVPQNGNLILSAEVDGFLPSYEALAVAAYDVPNKDFILAYTPHLDTVAQAFNVNYKDSFNCHAPNTGLCQYAVVMGRVVDDGTAGNGTPTPLGDVQLTEFTIRVEGDATWYKKGPYALYPTGVPYPEGTTTQRAQIGGKYRGGLFVYFVEVPVDGPISRNFDIQISSYAGGPQQRYFGPSSDLAFRGGFTWVTVAESGIVAPPGNEPPPVDVSFTNEVYPLFLTVDQGGYGCLGCHTNQGQTPAGGLNLYGGPAAAFAALNPAQYPNRVNLANPAASLVLTKPLYETDGVQNHPIFAFLSEQDPGYRTLYGWIQGGAIDDTVNAPVVLTSFYNDVRPLLYLPIAQGGAGCYDCHVNGVDAVTAPGGAYFGGDGNALYQVLTQDTPTDNGFTGQPYRINRAGFPEQSLLLLNPTLGTIEPHPAKLLNGVTDVRYQTIYRWIVEGYANDTPP